MGRGRCQIVRPQHLLGQSRRRPDGRAGGQAGCHGHDTHRTSKVRRRIGPLRHVIAHEVAHAWFGNLVTMRWFDDVWTKEVFANFVAAKIVTPSFPATNHDLRFFLDHYPGAYAEDRTAGAGPVRQSLANLADAGSLYTNIIYLKAPVAMRHLESLLGEENFRDGLREYLRAHAYANATWARRYPPSSCPARAGGDMAISCWTVPQRRNCCAPCRALTIR